jgi:hypothetical protein
MDFSWLFDLVQQILNWLLSILQWIWNAIVYVANFIWGILLQVFQWAWAGLKAVANIFRSIWDNFIKRIFLKVLNAITKAHLWLEQKLAPILNFLKKVRALYDHYFKLYVKPFLDVIQKIRRILAVLRFLHIKWAQTLDAELAKIEGKIAQVVLTIRGILNSMIDLVTTIADPMLLIRRPTAVISFRRVFLAMIRVLTGRPPGYFIPSPRKGAKNGLGFLPPNFLPSDPSFNPLASSYLPGDDGLGAFNGFTTTQPPEDTAVDELTMLDYFDDSLYDPPDCTDVIQCLRDTIDHVTARPALG